MQLQADELTCHRGGREIFRGLSFNLSAGEAMVVTGRNGAGKSSLLRMIAGLVRIAGGRLALQGGQSDTPLAEQAHYLGHHDAMKPGLSVGGLPAAYLSAGQRRRLSIARLVAVPRAIWLLDEPTSTLDAPSQKKLAELMRGHLAGGGMIVAAAHGPIGLERARELKLGPA
jgi:heme exporter protein A